MTGQFNICMRVCGSDLLNVWYFFVFQTLSHPHELPYPHLGPLPHEQYTRFEKQEIEIGP